uniref:Uncharacterized protein n=1 Tax=Oryza barthii TaxID=65489 RepID=A0A0D3HV60_9ORYZ
MASVSVSTDGQPIIGDAASSSRISIEFFAYSLWTTGLVLYYNFKLDMMLDFMLPLCALYNTKVLIKLVAFHRARCSFALGRNVEVISGYMAQAYAKNENNNGNPPPYIVMGEEKRHLKKTPDGYRIKVSSLDSSTTTASELLTVDRIQHFVFP